MSQCQWLTLNVGPEVIDQREEQGEKGGGDNPSGGSQGDGSGCSQKVMIDMKASEAGKKVGDQQRREYEGDDDGDHKGDADRGQPGLPIGAAFLHPVDHVEAFLDGGKTYGSGPQGRCQAKSQLAAAGGGRGLMKGLQHRPQSGGRNHNPKVHQEIFIECGRLSGRPGRGWSRR